MYLKKQQGKGLFNFMAGSIVALGAIAAVLFTLDKNSARDFKQPQLAEHNKPAAPEVLSPHAGASSGPAPTIEPAVSDEKQPALRQAPSAGHNETVKTDTLAVQAASESIAKPVPPVKPRTETVQNKPKPATQDGEGAKTTNTDVAADDVQPTAEQILNSGNLEKAREVAQREARERRARQAAVAREKAAQAATSANKHAAEEKPVSTTKQHRHPIKILPPPKANQPQRKMLPHRAKPAFRPVRTTTVRLRTSNARNWRRWVCRPKWLPCSRTAKPCTACRPTR